MNPALFAVVAISLPDFLSTLLLGGRNELNKTFRMARKLDRTVAEAQQRSAEDRASLRDDLRMQQAMLLEETSHLSAQLEAMERTLAQAETLLRQRVETLPPAPGPHTPSQPAVSPPPVADRSPETLNRDASNAYLRSDFDAAIAHYSELVRNYRNHPLAVDALFWRAECYRRQQRYYEAATDLTAFVARGEGNPLLPSALDSGARILAQIGRNAEAKEWRDRLLREFPNSTQARQLKGQDRAEEDIELHSR